MEWKIISYKNYFILFQLKMQMKYLPKTLSKWFQMDGKIKLRLEQIPSMP